MTSKRKITDKNGVQVFPITHTKAVLDDNGNSVEERLQENLDLINQKQLEIGAVPSDVTPTAGSTNWVTSGGVYGEVTSSKDINMTELYQIPLVLYQDKWMASNGQNYSKHICVIPGQKYIIETDNTYGVNIYYLSVFAPSANTAATYTLVQLEEGKKHEIIIPDNIYHLVFLDNHNQTGGFSLIPSVKQVDYTNALSAYNNESIREIDNNAARIVYNKELAVYNYDNCTNNNKTLKVSGSLGSGSGFKCSDFLPIPSNATHIEFKNVTANYHDELCGLVIADSSYHVLWYNNDSYGQLCLADYPNATYMRFMPLYGTQYASVKLMERSNYGGEYIALSSGAFDMQGNITANAGRAYVVIRNPQDVISVADRYAMIVFGGSVSNPSELVANGVAQFNASEINHPTLWIMVKAAEGTDIDISERDLSEVISVGGSLVNIVSKENRLASSLLSAYIVDKNGNGQFASISDAVAGVPDGSTIIVMPGTYEESVHMWGRNLNIVGIDKNSCILINGTGNYSTPPLEANVGSISNMTIIADNYAPTIDDPTINKTKPSYCIHIEHAEDDAFQLRISNCVMLAKWNAAIGLGLRYNQTVIIENCDVRTDCVTTWSSGTSMWIEQGALFFHNDAEANNNETGHLRVSNCRLSGLKPALSVLCVYNHPYVMAEFVNNTLISDTYGIGDGVIYKRGQIPAQGYWSGDRISLSLASHGNNVADINTV